MQQQLLEYGRGSDLDLSVRQRVELCDRYAQR
jgi:hypothetical protein